ncbi:uncharacterized protein N7518_008837 [Penicillium psychrosexuale]|uniref:uncharacterized protein n=1 Tax=Penicillium psychrosexuale TaxID=1002107 RepID=UPI0025451E40|nr:uncharacterized protein N7518_008837 [Penicillium psychrosexuale]KAI3287977.1 hypothetical protein DTO002I6_7590 [Penicillium roqueforti]KAJ5791826.1 hypothetical protein N7518_008837 [Penicillium psychrosexuale]
MAQNEDINPRPFNPRPFCPIPRVIEPQQRIKQLREYLEDPAPKMQRHRTNIQGLIRMYETGELGPLVFPGQETIWICEGKIMDPPPRLDDLVHIIPHSAVWAEGFYQQLMQQTSPQITTLK